MFSLSIDSNKKIELATCYFQTFQELYSSLLIIEHETRKLIFIYTTNILNLSFIFRKHLKLQEAQPQFTISNIGIYNFEA